MSDRNALVELANFIGRSPLASPDMKMRNQALAGMTNRMLPRQKRSVGDLLAVVMALSARTRRLSQPVAQVEIDVFAPGGARALRLTLPKVDAEL
jgi:hypothetical protein